MHIISYLHLATIPAEVAPPWHRNCRPSNVARASRLDRKVSAQDLRAEVAISVRLP